MRSIAVFGLVTVGVVFAALGGHTRMYEHVDRYGWGWFVGSVAVAVVVHDVCFYWAHRLMHPPRLFRALHRAHHRSTNPTAWAASLFGTVEAVVQAGIGPLLVFTSPVRPAALVLLMTWQVAFNLFGHCGYEIFPRWFLRTRAGGC